MIKRAELIAQFERMAAEGWRYEAGGASEGAVDCSGAFVYAFRQLGESIYHGSNRIARAYVAELRPIAQVQPGDAVFRRRAPGEKGYSLPAVYRTGGSMCNGDLNDYYHIGLADAEGTRVLNASGSANGFVRSGLDGWQVCGRLKAVQESAEAEQAGERRAVLSLPPEKAGQTVNLRAAPGGAVLDRLREGTEAEVLEEAGEWTRIRAGGRTGWVMARFLSGGEPLTLEGLARRVEALEALMRKGAKG